MPFIKNLEKVYIKAHRVPRGPRPYPPVKRSKRAIRRYQGKLRRSGWCWVILGEQVRDDINRVIEQKGFMRRLLEKTEADNTFAENYAGPIDQNKSV